MCLSFPVLAGHTQTSGGAWCECNNPDAPHTMSGQSITNVSDDKGTSDSTGHPTTPDYELALLLLAVVILLRAKV